MSFLEHLEELRWHIVRSLISVISFAIVAFIFSRYIFDYVLLAPKGEGFITNRLLCQFADRMQAPELCINSNPLKLVSIEMPEQFYADIMVSLYAGLLVAFPYIIWEVWRFIMPALYENEQKHARGSVLSISAMFFLGALFGYFIIVPLTVHFLAGWSVNESVESTIRLKSYISTIAFIPGATGIVFELPILMVFLTKVGIITPNFMIKYRKHAIIILMIVASVITPPDIWSMLLVMVPLILLYQISIFLCKRVVKKQQQAERAENR